MLFVFSVDNYPSDSVRAELSAKTELSDRQLQMWFCHRRLKDRKGEKKTKKGEAPPPATASVGVAVAGTLPRLPPVGSVDDMFDDDLGNEHGSGSGSGSGSSPYGHMDPHRAYVGHPGGAVPRTSGRGRYHEPSQSLIQYRAIAFVEAQLGEPLTEDSPALGIEFDPLPPGAFNAPIGKKISYNLFWRWNNLMYPHYFFRYPVAFVATRVGFGQPDVRNLTVGDNLGFSMGWTPMLNPYPACFYKGRVENGQSGKLDLLQIKWSGL